MTSPTDLLSLFIPLTAADREQAERLARLQVTVEGATRVYRNALAVLATAQYLKMLDIASDLEASYSFNPAVQLVADMADLYIPEVRRRIECRSVHRGEHSVYIPEEVWEDRLGFVIVQVDDNGTRANLIGFVPEASVEQLPLSYLRPLDLLFDKMAAEPISQETDAASVVISLSTWKDKVAGLGWSLLRDMPPSPGLKWVFASDRNADEAVQKAVLNLYQSDSNLTFLPSHQLENSPIEALANLITETQDDWIRWQAAELLQTIAPEHSAAAIIGAKDLGLYLAGQTIALLVGTITKPNGQTLVMARVYPMGDLVILPSGLELTGLTSEGKSFFEVTSRKRDDYIQFLFTADLGDEFKIKVSLDTISVTERFSI